MSWEEVGWVVIGAGAEPRRTTLRRGSAREAGLLSAPLDLLVAEAERYLGSSPDHPWYAGAVLLAGRGGTVALHRAIGSAVRYAAYDEGTDTGVELPSERRIPVTEDTVFDLASVSKLFTSLLAVQQLERGALGLEERVTDRLPEFGGGGKRDVTVRQLLTHTSGLRPEIPLYREPTREGKLRLLWDERPVHAPGSTYLYSDLNLISLQLILEEITGLGLDTLLHDEITAPLGMHRTRFGPPLSWRPEIAATEDARPPWSGLDRGMVWGEVHDENAYALGGVAGHAGIFSRAWDLAVLARTLLNGGAYGPARILSPASVELMFTDFNTAFPGDAHGLGFELQQYWYMGAMATPRTAGHTGFTGTGLVLDPTTDTFLVVLGNSVHPVRSWRSGSAPRVAAANHLARAVPVRPAGGGTAWFSGMTPGATGTLTLPPVPGAARWECALWWDTVPGADAVLLEASRDGGTTWEPLPFETVRPGGEPESHPSGAVGGWSGRVWHRLTAEVPRPLAPPVRLRLRYATVGRYVGRGVYVDGMRLLDAEGRVRFDEARPADGARVEAVGWVRSAD
ncbi:MULTISPECIES: serine hydrolase domain-containing protein [unclassified Streptomyces]|uniref:serine hydrolase domain-containing protein n=1 Tax=unclassified Streptomyces TaxID=2593676 RepID=UPI0006F99FFE|nr:MULTISPECIES: serine hydrolase domain-containing protein [unclassified Streptomyces]KQX49951.1 serine hydrolase [Streptomyces sp. Root1304]KRA80006.1 serine hydrolase [Streptomyces sp. Root66D1]